MKIYNMKSIEQVYLDELATEQSVYSMDAIEYELHGMEYSL